MRLLKPWAQKESDDFYARYGGGNCSCHISPPCGSCMHPGNPVNLAEDDDAWGFDLDYAVKQAIDRLTSYIETEARQHTNSLKDGTE